MRFNNCFIVQLKLFHSIFGYFLEAHYYVPIIPPIPVACVWCSCFSCIRFHARCYFLWRFLIILLVRVAIYQLVALLLICRRKNAFSIVENSNPSVDSPIAFLTSILYGGIFVTSFHRPRRKQGICVALQGFSEPSYFARIVTLSFHLRNSVFRFSLPLLVSWEGRNFETLFGDWNLTVELRVLAEWVSLDQQYIGAHFVEWKSRMVYKLPAQLSTCFPLVELIFIVARTLCLYKIFKLDFYVGLLGWILALYILTSDSYTGFL